MPAIFPSVISSFLTQNKGEGEGEGGGQAPPIDPLQQHYRIYTLLIKMEPRREINLSGSNEYLCFETNNSRTGSSGFYFYMAFLVVETRNQRQLIKYAYIRRAIFGGGPHNLKRIKYLNLVFAIIIYSPNPTFVPNLSKIGNLSCITSSLVLPGDADRVSRKKS